MSPASWLRPLKSLFADSRPARRSRRPRPGAKRPAVELLEDRTVPAGILSAATPMLAPMPAATPTVTTVVPGWSNPFALTIDQSGNLYVVDQVGSHMNKVTPSGVVSMLVPPGAGLSNPWSITIDGGGNLYVGNVDSNSVSLVTPAGAVSTYVPAGAGLSTPTALAFDRNSGILYVANNDTSVSKVMPDGSVSPFFAGFQNYGRDSLAVDASGNVYIANSDVQSILKVTPAGDDVSTFVSGISGWALAFDGSGSLYVTDANSFSISKVAPNGTVTPFSPLFGNSLAVNAAGTVYVLVSGASPSEFSIQKVTASGQSSTFVTAKLSGLTGLASDSAGNIYVATLWPGTVSKVTPSGAVSTFVSDFYYGPVGLVRDGQGNLFFLGGDGTLNKVTPDGSVTPLASGFLSPGSLAIDAAGNLYVGSREYRTVSKVSPNGDVSIYVPSDVVGFPDALAVDGSGNLYVAQMYGSSVIEVMPDRTTRTFASGFSGGIGALAFDSVGNLFVATLYDSSVRKVAPDGTISPYVSSGLSWPTALAFDPKGNLYVADGLTNSLSRVSTGPVNAAPQELVQQVANDLTALRATITDKQDGHRLDDALKHLNKALDSSLWADPSHLIEKGGDRFFNEIKDAINPLLDLLKDRHSTVPAGQVQAMIDDLVKASRAIAQTALDDAIAAGADARKTARAGDELAKADAQVLAGRFVDALEHYRSAWQQALKAMR